MSYLEVTRFKHTVLVNDESIKFLNEAAMTHSANGLRIMLIIIFAHSMVLAHCTGWKW